MKTSLGAIQDIEPSFEQSYFGIPYALRRKQFDQISVLLQVFVVRFQLNIQSVISSASQHHGPVDVLSSLQLNAAVGVLVALEEAVEDVESVDDGAEV